MKRDSSRHIITELKAKKLTQGFTVHCAPLKPKQREEIETYVIDQFEHWWEHSMLPLIEVMEFRLIKDSKKRRAK